MIKRKKLNTFGPGISLYFHFLRKGFFLFGFFAVITFVTLPQYFIKLFGSGESAPLDTVFLIILSSLKGLLLILFLNWLNLRESYIIHQVDVDNDTPADYTVVVSGINPEIKDPQVYKKHFEDLLGGKKSTLKDGKPRIVNVLIAVHAGNFLETLQREQEAEDELEYLKLSNEEKKITKKYLKPLQRFGYFRDKIYWKSQLDKAKVEVRKLKQKKMWDFEKSIVPTRVFITFNSKTDAHLTLELTQHKWTFGRRILFFLGLIKHKIGEQDVKVSYADEPSDIQWSNLNVRRKSEH